MLLNNSEALLELAVGGTPQPQVFERAIPESNPFNHPDALRRFRVMSNMDELELALDSPWEKWSIFLHPAQSELVERDYNGPARVAGSAGTGKTIVALHRAVYLAKHDLDARVLLTTFSDSLANALHYKLTHLIGNQPRLGERLEVKSMNAIGLRLYKASGAKHVLTSDEHIRAVIDEKLSDLPEIKFSTDFIFAEWKQVVDAWQLTSWEAYRDVRRLGRKTRLSEQQRVSLWAIYQEVNKHLESSNLITMAGIFFALAEKYATQKNPPFDYTVIDEAQDSLFQCEMSLKRGVISNVK